MDHHPDNTPAPRALHPNLARLAARYDEIIELHRRGVLDERDAQLQIAELVTRDDNGARWSLDPTNGTWLRHTHDGDVVADEPPTSGYASPTPAQVTRHSPTSDPARRILFEAVSDTNPLETAPPEAPTPERPELNMWLLVAVVVLVVVVVAVFLV